MYKLHMYVCMKVHHFLHVCMYVQYVCMYHIIRVDCLMHGRLHPAASLPLTLHICRLICMHVHSLTPLCCCSTRGMYTQAVPASVALNSSPPWLYNTNFTSLLGVTSLGEGQAPANATELVANIITSSN